MPDHTAFVRADLQDTPSALFITIVLAEHVRPPHTRCWRCRLRRILDLAQPCIVIHSHGSEQRKRASDGPRSQRIRVSGLSVSAGLSAGYSLRVIQGLRHSQFQDLRDGEPAAGQALDRTCRRRHRAGASATSLWAPKTSSPPAARRWRARRMPSNRYYGQPAMGSKPTSSGSWTRRVVSLSNLLCVDEIRTEIVNGGQDPLPSLFWHVPKRSVVSGERPRR